MLISVGNDDRIYKDRSTDRFINDVLALLGNGTDCTPPTKASFSPGPFFEFNVHLFLLAFRIV
jgi:hypothetical protein